MASRKRKSRERREPVVDATPLRASRADAGERRLSAPPQARVAQPPAAAPAVLLVRRARAVGADRLPAARSSRSRPICRRSIRSKFRGGRRRSRSSAPTARLIATRGEMHGATLTLKEMPPYPAEGVPRDRGPPLLQSLRHRPDRPGAGRRRQPEPPRRIAGRLDHHPAARQEPVPHAGAHLHAQAAGAGAGALARAEVLARPRSSSSISTASISAPAPMASTPRRSAISASPPAT